MSRTFHQLQRIELNGALNTNYLAALITLMIKLLMNQLGGCSFGSSWISGESQWNFLWDNETNYSFFGLMRLLPNSCHYQLFGGARRVWPEGSRQRGREEGLKWVTITKFLCKENIFFSIYLPHFKGFSISISFLLVSIFFLFFLPIFCPSLVAKQSWYFNTRWNRIEDFYLLVLCDETLSLFFVVGVLPSVLWVYCCCCCCCCRRCVVGGGRVNDGLPPLKIFPLSWLARENVAHCRRRNQTCWGNPEPFDV